jgi:hypothetical protein
MPAVIFGVRHIGWVYRQEVVSKLGISNNWINLEFVEN